MRIALASLLCLALASPAAAEEFAPLSMGEARDIARDAGVAEIEEIEVDDGVWEIDGRDRDGNDVEIEIDRITGEIVKARRD